MSKRMIEKTTKTSPAHSSRMPVSSLIKAAKSLSLALCTSALLLGLQGQANAQPKKDLPEAAAPTTSANPFGIEEEDISPDAPYDAYQRGRYLTAFSLATKLAGKGDTAAQTLLGELYNRGEGIPEDAKEAAAWYQIASDSGNKDAQFALGMLHIEGRGVKKDMAKAIALFEKASKQDQAKAQFNLAVIYLQGQSVRQDTTRALDLFSKAAKAGVPEAQYALASLYQSDLFPTPDYAQASYWMQKAAEGGFVDAQLEYGLMLFKGQGVAKDYAASKAWLERAADSGSTLAQNRLARILARGFGESPQPVKAAKYYLMSVKGGKKDEWLASFFQTLTPAQVQQAQALVKQRSLW